MCPTRRNVQNEHVAQKNLKYSLSITALMCNCCGCYKKYKNNKFLHSFPLEAPSCSFVEHVPRIACLAIF